ncbi:MAG TPA: hypothetical protein VJL29_14060 [Thermoguttaceae bacterium]|nr:hypothetical protein [Thermoguttaceae bacterium]
MRGVGLILGLVLAGWVLTEIPVARTESLVAAGSQWKRTVDGWEPRDSWLRGPFVQPARLHPALVGAFELLVSLAALVAFSGSPRTEPARATDGEPCRNCPHRRPRRRSASPA